MHVVDIARPELAPPGNMYLLVNRGKKATGVLICVIATCSARSLVVEVRKASVRWEVEGGGGHLDGFSCFSI